jgi:hypothetical protein
LPITRSCTSTAQCDGAPLTAGEAAVYGCRTADAGRRRDSDRRGTRGEECLQGPLVRAVLEPPAVRIDADGGAPRARVTSRPADHDLGLRIVDDERELPATAPVRGQKTAPRPCREQRFEDSERVLPSHKMRSPAAYQHCSTVRRFVTVPRSSELGHERRRRR